MFNQPILSAEKYSSLVRERGIETLYQLINFVQHLPYGRNADRGKPELVLLEQKGTCSTKHALIALVAKENHIHELKLVLGIYQMHQSNTPKIGDALDTISMKYIPEAHCYLKYNDERLDLTAPTSSFDRISAAIMEEIEIQPEQTGDFKVHYHQAFIRTWIEKENIPLSFERIWETREECIRRLGAAG